MSAPPHSRRQAGFSLTELMIVIAIVGVLAAIGMPAYTDYSRASKRTDATQALSRMAQLQERFFTDNNTYATNTELLGYGNLPAETNGGYWTMTVTAGGATYGLRAVPANGHVDNDCTAMTLDSTGSKGFEGTGKKDCWAGK